MPRRPSRHKPRTPRPETAAAPAPVPPPRPASPPFWTGWRVALGVVALLLVHLSLAVLSLVRENPTIDEVVHLPAGITYWEKGTFRLYHHNPPLVRMLAAWPVLGLTKVDYSSPAWTTEPPNKAQLAHEYMAQNVGNYFEVFTRARLMMPIFSLIGGLVVFFWSRALYGNAAGLLSLTLWSFCPNILAHARLITTDIAATSLGVAATFLFWLYLRKPSTWLAALAGLALGVGQITKFSLIVLYALWPLLALVRLAISPEFRADWWKVGLHAFLVVVVSVLVIDLGYEFEGVGTPLGQFEFISRTLTRPVTPGMRRPQSTDQLYNGAWKYRVNRLRDTWLGALPSPLPRHYLLGFDAQKIEAEGVPRKFLNPAETGPTGDRVDGYPVFLDGVLAQKSWWYYYLLTLVYKVPEGTWLLVLTSVGVLLFGRTACASGFDEFAVLVVPAFVVFVMSVFTNINLGLRYVLPIFPYLYIATGKLAPWVACLALPRLRRIAATLVGLGLGLSVAACIAIHPSYLAYFNQVSGGPDHGAAHLIDSNIDWGQDLVGLRDWLRTNAPGERVGLAYFGQINPRIFNDRGEGFDWFLPPPTLESLFPPEPGQPLRIPTTPEALLSVPTRYRTRLGDMRLEPGLYAVSASLVKGLPWRLYDSPAASFERERWSPWRLWVDAFRYFDRLQPVAKVGYSIWIYRVTPEQAEAVSSRTWPRFSSEAGAANPLGRGF